MIKKAALLTLLFISFNQVSAQSTDNTDVKALVEQQIRKAKAKHDLPASTTSEKSAAEIEISPEEEESYLESLLIRASLFLTLSGIIVIVVFKRREAAQKKEIEKRLRNNIKKVREEQLIKSIDPRLKAIRQKLCLNSNRLYPIDATLSQAAKKWNIAKGEILLASKINSYQLEDQLSGSRK